MSSFDSTQTSQQFGHPQATDKSQFIQNGKYGPKLPEPILMTHQSVNSIPKPPPITRLSINDTVVPINGYQ